MLAPPSPERRVVFLNHLDQCHIAGRAHEITDPVKPVFIQCVVGGMFPHQVQPHMQRRPVVNRCSTEPRLGIGIFPDSFALCTAYGLISVLTDKRKAFPPVQQDPAKIGWTHCFIHMHWEDKKRWGLHVSNSSPCRIRHIFNKKMLLFQIACIKEFDFPVPVPEGQ